VSSATATTKFLLNEIADKRHIKDTYTIYIYAFLVVGGQLTGASAWPICIWDLFKLALILFEFWPNEQIALN